MTFTLFEKKYSTVLNQKVESGKWKVESGKWKVEGRREKGEICECPQTSPRQLTIALQKTLISTCIVNVGSIRSESL
jgi:hypothetical protein